MGGLSGMLTSYKVLKEKRQRVSKKFKEKIMKPEAKGEFLVRESPAKIIIDSPWK